MKYFIAVEVEATGPMTELVSALRSAYDIGPAGNFNVLVTKAPTYMVVFERDSEEDAQYVSKRAESGEAIEKAAMQQLAAELEEADAGALVQPIIDDLRNGDAQCFDYAIGAFEAMAENLSSDFADLYSKRDIEHYRARGYVTRSGVVYVTELSGFVLLREPQTTKQMLQDAVSQLSRDFDVVGRIRVVPVCPF